MKTILLITLLLCAACVKDENKPTPFETGSVTSTPYGCLEGRERGVDC